MNGQIESLLQPGAAMKLCPASDNGFYRKLASTKELMKRQEAGHTGSL